MMLNYQRKAAFIEVCKNASTACAVLLRNHGWWQNGAKNRPRIPHTLSGRHAYLTRQAKEHMTEAGWTVYGVVRNPWDRMASLWRADDPQPAFGEMLKRGRYKMGGVSILIFDQVDWLYGVDHVLRYEHLERDLAAHAEDLGLHAAPKLPPVNISRSRATPPWTPELIDLVGARFNRDVERWGYTPPPLA